MRQGAICLCHLEWKILCTQPQLAYAGHRCGSKPEHGACEEWRWYRNGIDAGPRAHSIEGQSVLGAVQRVPRVDGQRPRSDEAEPRLERILSEMRTQEKLDALGAGERGR